MPYIWIPKVRYRKHLPDNQHCHFIFRVLYKSISMYTEIVKKKKISVNVILLLISFIHWYIISTVTIMKGILSVWSLGQLNQYHLKTQFSSVAQLCLTLCDPMNHNTPGLPVRHQLPEFTQTHVHRVRDAIQPSHPRSSPSPPAPNPSQHQSLFQ